MAHRVCNQNNIRLFTINDLSRCCFGKVGVLQQLADYMYLANRLIKVEFDRYLEFLYPLKIQSSGVQEMNA